MKVCVKKIQCPNCQRRIKCHEQKTNGLVNIVCPACGKAIYAWNGISWKPLVTHD